ncbi:MAG: LLM class flavin-dependent oxidoreductase [Deltaproteobacteria bacterium]|nr:LLM class flavin-dependent oxidoreductase [Deltaproteobacteria bacterium]
MSGKRVEIGVTPWLFDDGGLSAGFAAQAERAEALGFHSIFIPEHHFAPGAIPSPLLLLAAAASRTRRIRLGTTSYLLPLRHPLHAAAEVAVLDQVSNGRVILGVGRGFQKAMFSAFDVARAEKRELFEAVLARMREAWDGKPVVPDDAAGPPAVLSPLPVQRPHPPIWVAAFGPKALAQAGRLALPYLASPMEPVSQLAENLMRHREACEAAGRELPSAVPLMRTVFVSDDASALARASAALEQQMRAMARAPSAVLRRGAEGDVEDWALVGEPARVADAIAALEERFGMTHLIVRAQIPGLEPAEAEASLECIAALG